MNSKNDAEDLLTEALSKSCCNKNTSYRHSNTTLEVVFSEEVFSKLLAAIDEILECVKDKEGKALRFTNWDWEMYGRTTRGQCHKIYELLENHTRFSSSPEQENAYVQKLALTYPRHFKIDHVCAITNRYILVKAHPDPTLFALPCLTLVIDVEKKR